MRAIENGNLLEPKVVIYMQRIETFTWDDYLPLDGASQSTTSTSSEGSYEISNMTIKLFNRDYYFSRYFYDEMPIGKLVVVYDTINNTDIERFRGKVTEDWYLDEQYVYLPLTV